MYDEDYYHSEGFSACTMQTGTHTPQAKAALEPLGNWHAHASSMPVRFRVPTIVTPHSESDSTVESDGASKLKALDSP